MLRSGGGPSNWVEIGFTCNRCGYSYSREHWFSFKIVTIPTDWGSWMDVQRFYSDWNQLLASGQIQSKAREHSYLQLRCTLREGLNSDKVVHLIDTHSKRRLLDGKHYLIPGDDISHSGSCPCPNCESLDGYFSLSLIHA